jgi:adenylate kinase family enzyme
LAILHARQGKKVLIIDLDLEAPGQSQSGLFNAQYIQEAKTLKGGFTDLCLEWQKSFKENKAALAWQLKDYTVRSTELDDRTFEGVGDIYLLPATKQLDNQYAQTLHQLNWDDFFGDSIKGYLLMADIRTYCELEEYDSVFIDSRTGLSDPYYMATSWLTDSTVCFTLLNEQSIAGCKGAMNAINSPSFIKGYGKKHIVPVACMLPPSLGESVQKRINEIKDKEWLELNEQGFASTILYDETMALRATLPLLNADNNMSLNINSYTQSIIQIDEALDKKDTDYLLTKQRVKQSYKGELENPFPNLRIEYCNAKEVEKYYSNLYPSIREQLLAFPPIIIFGSRGTGKTTLARHLDYETQLVQFAKENPNQEPIPEHFPQVVLWIRQDSDLLAAFNTPDAYKQVIYNQLFSAFLDLMVLRKMLEAMDKIEGIQAWVNSTTKLFKILSREMGRKEGEPLNNLEQFSNYLDEYLSDIRGYINNPNDSNKPYMFLSNTLLKLLTEQFKPEIQSYFVVILDEVENYASYQQRTLNTRVKHIKRSNLVTYKLLARNEGIKTSKTDATGQLLEVTHDYKAYFLDEAMNFQEFHDQVNTFIHHSLQQSPSFSHFGEAKTFLNALTPQEEAQEMFETRRQTTHPPPLVSYVKKELKLPSEHPFLQWLDQEQNILRQAVAVILLNQGKEIEQVLNEFSKNSSKAKDWYHNYSTGALFWLCRLYNKNKIYAGINDLVGVSGNNIRVVVLILGQLFQEWIENKDTGTLFFSVKQQNKVIHEQSQTQVKLLDRFKFTDNRLDRFVARLGTLFRALHKSPKQSEPEINHFSIQGDVDEKIDKYLRLCRQENILQWMPSNKQKNSSDYVPDAYRFNPVYAPDFDISWRRKKKLILTSKQIEILCFGQDNEWKTIHKNIVKKHDSSNIPSVDQQPTLL